MNKTVGLRERRRVMKGKEHGDVEGPKRMEGVILNFNFKGRSYID